MCYKSEEKAKKCIISILSSSMNRCRDPIKKIVQIKKSESFAAHFDG